MSMTIQEAAQKVLLIFYKRYKDTGVVTEDMLTFTRDIEWKFETEDESLQTALIETVKNATLLKVAVQYLEDKNLIVYKTVGVLSGDLIMHHISITSPGVDMIEGVGGAGNSRDVYEQTFNVTLNNNITVESLLKAELKASILSLL